LRGGGFHKNETVYLFKERERERFGGFIRIKQNIFLER